MPGWASVGEGVPNLVETRCPRVGGRVSKVEGSLRRRGGKGGRTCKGGGAVSRMQRE